MTYNESGSLGGAMRSLNLDVEEVDQDFASMAFPQLADTKRKIEAALEHLFSLLHEVYKFDMESPLTRDGFPRSDIDVVSIRLVRTKIIRLRNDHSKIMHLLSSVLSEQFRPSSDSPTAAIEPNAAPKANPFARISFAVVKSVAPHSPAEHAGLSIGDRITTFDGNINATNHQNLAEIAKRVKAKEGRHIEVVVLRGPSSITLDLVPTSNWEGRGLLGCHIVPM